MFKVSLKGLAARKLRLVLVSFAVVLGVAFMSGTLVFTDSINNAFGQLFSESYANTDVTINAAAAEKHGHQEGFDTPSTRMPESLLTDLRKIPGVEVADGAVTGLAQIIDTKGKPIGGHGPPTLGFSWITVRRLSALHIAKGRPPHNGDEVVIDVSTAQSHHLKIGDTVQVVFREQADKFTIVGFAGFGSSNQTLGATLAIFDLRTAQARFKAEGKLDLIDVAAKSGVSAKTLRKRIDKRLSNKYIVRTGAEQAKENLAQISNATGFIRKAMLFFAAISLLVGAFIIFNTFSITVAQRSRELGLFRAIGATRRQVLSSVVIEGFAIGVIASLIGLISGIGVAYLIRSLIRAIAGSVPTGNLALSSTTIIVSCCIGVFVTVISSIIPAVRASRVSPLEAMRNATVEAKKMRKLTIVFGLLVVIAAAILIASGLFGGASVTPTLVQLGGGFVVLVIGMAILAPLFVRPLVRILGYPVRKLGAVTGQLACENAVRNPKRTAATAAALMIGIGLVSFATIFTESLSTTVTNQVDSAFAADYMLSSESMSQSKFDPKLAEDLDNKRQINAVGVREGDWKLGKRKSGQRLLAGDPQRLGLALTLHANGRTLAHDLTDDSIFVSSSMARAHKWRVGDSITMTIAQRKQPIRLRISGVFTTIGLTEFLVTKRMYEANFPQSRQRDSVVFVRAAKGYSNAQARGVIDKAIQDYPFIKVQDQTAVKAEIKKGFQQLLALLFGLLSLSLVIALLGIIITLALSVFERTREIGLLRAVGMSRWQVRRMIAGESVLIALVGAILGLALGISLGWAGVRALHKYDVEFAMPFLLLFALMIVGMVAGIVAAIYPARRAARLKILEAIGSD